MPKRSDVRLTKKRVEEARPGDFLWDAEVPGFGLRVTKAGCKTFIAQYRTRLGRQGRVAIGRYPTLTTDEARSEARSLMVNVTKGGDPATERRTTRQAPTLRDLAAEYLDVYAPAAGLRPATIRDARSLVTRAAARVGQRKVSEFAAADIRRLHSEMRAESGVYQANRLRAFLSKMFSLAVELGWRTDNPCRSVKKFPEDQRWRNLSEDEVARLLVACERYENRNAADAIRLLLFTGARLREALSADWSQFDLEVGIWEKPSAHTKTKRKHRLELEGPALDLLRDMRRRDPQGTFLFPGETNRTVQPLRPRPRSDLKRPWSWVCREARLENVRLHDLRRTTASFMISGGASLATVGKALGHTQAATTARYAQLSESVQRSELRLAGERMAAAVARQRPSTVVSFSHGGGNEA